MERHGRPGVAALKIITKPLSTLFFEVHINLERKHNKMKLKLLIKTICHQFTLFFGTQTLYFSKIKLSYKYKSTLCSVTSQSETWSSRYCVAHEDSQYGP